MNMTDTPVTISAACGAWEWDDGTHCHNVCPGYVIDPAQPCACSCHKQKPSPCIEASIGEVHGGHPFTRTKEPGVQIVLWCEGVEA